MRVARRFVWAWMSLTVLSGCDDSSVNVCFGDVVFCNQAFSPVARAGANQTVVSGDVVTLNGSNSSSNGGSIESFSWTQTSGPTVALTDANKARATFVAPAVVTNTTLTFRLTVVNGAGRAGSDSTTVTVQPRSAAAVAEALQLLDGPLQPATTVAVPAAETCASATSALPPDLAAAQRGLWLAARSLAIVKELDANDPSSFLDAARVLVAEHAQPADDLPGRIESFGFALLGSLVQQRDPALQGAVSARQQRATLPEDLAALLGGASEVTGINGVNVETVADPAAANGQAMTQLLAARAQCIVPANALGMTAAAWRVIAAAKVPVE
jgi:hypothetical protein